ncbi:hypothetical protein dsx2_1536 [Desulfovibrio sp. X2]|uniref:hypothetical protein n=1 Tax=Desulfovibrio sp. X2 TaxID=941449 RepID=UPI0003589006|nr:hypothetical protein [Desulfovibrio sp. X2]EPR44577.1 hypothetical protein dsx2_1536 [Desulfovibrio sp. X2]
MYKQRLTAHDDYLAKAQPLPKNAVADGNQGSRDLSATQGALEVVVAAADDVSLAAGKSLTVTLVHAPDGGAFTPAGRTFTATAGASPLTFDAGEEICRLAVPSDLAPEAMLRVSTTDAAAAGSLDAWPEYLAR